MHTRFTKMHGLGNDFMVVDAAAAPARLTPGVIRRLADRHIGVGFDQLLLLEPPRSPDAACSFRIFNADGSSAEQCGNGLRCIARFVAERDRLQGEITLDSPSGPLRASVRAPGEVRACMGVPALEPTDIPYLHPRRQLRYREQAAGREVEFSALSMGNPHVVVEVASVDSAPVGILGPALESHPAFPARTNVEFMQIIGTGEIRLRVYERGAGETRACGSGACAAVVAGQLNGRLDRIVRVHLPGGELMVEWAGVGEPVWMTGEAVRVFEGEIEL